MCWSLLFFFLLVLFFAHYITAPDEESVGVSSFIRFLLYMFLQTLGKVGGGSNLSRSSIEDDQEVDYLNDKYSSLKPVPTNYFDVQPRNAGSGRKKDEKKVGATTTPTPTPSSTTTQHVIKGRSAQSSQNESIILTQVQSSVVRGRRRSEGGGRDGAEMAHGNFDGLRKIEEKCIV